MIAAATRHVIEQEMSKDPVFYKKFSKLLEAVIKAYHAERINALEALDKVKDISTKVVTYTDDDIPEELSGKDMARRYYGCVRETISKYQKINDEVSANISVQIENRVAQYKIRDWRTNQDAINKMRGEIDDIIFEASDDHDLELKIDGHDAIIDRCIEVTIANED